MVGALASRIDRWRGACDGTIEWDEAVRFSVYRDMPPAEESALTYSTEALRRFNEGLGGAADRDIIEGKIA